MINTNSRYKTSTAYDGTIIATRKSTQIEKYSIHSVKFGETMESIAVGVYGDPTLYWRIADMNPQISFPDSLQVGDVLRIPE